MEKFHIKIADHQFKKGDVLLTPGKGMRRKIKVIKIYPFTWYRKILLFFGCKIRTSDTAKVKYI